MTRIEEQSKLAKKMRKLERKFDRCNPKAILTRAAILRQAMKTEKRMKDISANLRLFA